MQRDALRLQQLFDDRNRRIRGAAWTRQEVLMGLTTDIGDLVRFSMMVDGRKDAGAVADPKEQLSAELADCLWSLIVLSNEYGIDLKASYETTMRELIERFGRESAEH
jgi:NTP pyrophosphatase (non-canonical NTP hydrolase)